MIAATQSAQSGVMAGATANPSAAISAPGEPARKEDTGATEPKFGEVLSNIQAQYGAKPEKQRSAKKTLDKDDFLKIMITQMRHQDPTSPFKAEQMATEMAQFTSVEQMQNINQTLNKMANQNSPLERMAMTNLIGKTVTVDKERFPHIEGQADTLNYALPKNATSVKIVIGNEKGETITERELGAVEAGEHSYSWDGLRSGSLPVKSGNLIFKVVATDSHGGTIPIQSQTRAQVVGVSFEGNEPALLIGDPSRPQKVGLKGLVRVDSDASAGMIPGARSLSAALSGGAAPAGAPLSALPSVSAPSAVGASAPAHAPAQAAPVADTGSNFFTFQKGSGSSAIDTSRLTPEVRAALSQYEKQRAEFDTEKVQGFPNGLSDSEAAPAAGAASPRKDSQSAGIAAPRG